MPVWAWTLIAVFGGCAVGAFLFLAMVHVGSTPDSEKGGVKVVLKKSCLLTDTTGEKRFFSAGATLTGWIEGDWFCFVVQYPDGDAVFKTVFDPETFEIRK